MRGAAAGVLLASLALPALPLQAQSFPAKPIRMVIPFAPGGGTDLIGRLSATRLSESMGQPVVVENRPGASGVVGVEFGVKAPPDGYTLTLLVSNYSSYPSLFKLSFDPVKDIQPVIQLSQGPMVVAVHPSVPAKNVRELIALAKKNPGALNYASTGHGAVSHLAVEHFGLMAGVQLTHIPYKGTGPALLDVVSGNVTVIFGSVLPTLPFVRNGKLRGIAVTTTTRIPAQPGLPTIAESGLPEYEAINWNGVILPRGTPRPIVERYNAEFGRMLKSRDVVERLEGDGSSPVGGSPEAFGERLAKEIALWTKVIARAGVKVD
ncbi:MAG: Bug family tripartite tricarboxylate transporter substrate binding protein [bacterium]|jgi:tripartite-type tricarboxylate transporter receptor subunit TctC|nr:tripartite tricarboxylate transporter substrate binding protein [Betaproteobacteria bacterium]